MLAVQAIKEVEKFLDFVGREETYTSMDCAIENVLRTTSCDGEISSNIGNDIVSDHKDLLPTLWDKFRRMHPGKARLLKNKNNDDAASSTPEAPIATPVQPDIAPTTQSSESDEEKRKRKEEEEAEKKRQEMKEKALALETERKRLRTIREQADHYLRESNVFHHDLSFDEYIKQQWNSKGNRVDLIISSIKPDCNDDVLKSLPNFSDKVLKPGAFAFFIVSELQYAILYREFKSLKFKLMEHSYKILYKTSTFQKRCVSDFPQRDSDIAIVARKQGTHPNGFQPAYASQPSRNLQTKIAFSSAINMDSCKDKLKKPSENSALCAWEKSVDVFQHVMCLFTPPGGTVMDPLAGALTAGIAALNTGRKCVVLEKNKCIYNFAVGRLRIFATPEATMKSLSDYSGPIDVDALEDEKEDNPGKDLCTKDGKSEDDHEGRPSPKRQCVRSNKPSPTDSSAKVDDADALGAQALLFMNSNSSK